MTSVAITVICWRRPEMTDLTLRTLLETVQHLAGVTVNVVQNEAGDNSTTRAVAKHSRHPSFKGFVTLRQNLGKVHANNAGWRLALKGGAEYLATVENDVYFRDGWIEGCVAALEAFEDVGQVSPTDHELDRHQRGRTEAHRCETETRGGVELHFPHTGVIPGTVVVRREVAEKFQHKSTGRLYEHSCPRFCREIARRGWRSAYLPGELAFHMHPENSTWRALGFGAEVTDRYRRHVDRLREMRQGGVK